MKILGAFPVAARVMAVGDPVGPLRCMIVHLIDAGFEVDQHATLTGALASLAAEEPCDAVLLEVGAADDGLDAIDALAGRGLPVVACFAQPTIRATVRAMKAGATDVLAGDAGPSALIAAVEAARRAREPAPTAPPQLETLPRRPEGLIGRSAGMLATMRRVEEYARSEAPVLITGETGTGKELVARGIHAASARARAAFVAVDCGAIPAELFESEFFGHEKGAFTGATSSQPGHLEAAMGGTLFLDEVGTMPLPLQAKLLRVIQDREHEPVGSPKAKRADFRLIAATNADLEAAMREGRFREDLYHRLCVLPVRLPPLRERLEDIPLLAEHFLRRHAERTGEAPRLLSRAALAQLGAYDWPGNVRELAGALERAALCAPGRVITQVVESGPRTVALRPYAQAVELMREGFEREYLRKLLLASRGNLTLASRISALSRRHLQRLRAKHGLELEDFGAPARTRAAPGPDDLSPSARWC